MKYFRKKAELQFGLLLCGLNGFKDCIFENQHLESAACCKRVFTYVTVSHTSSTF